MPSHSPITPCFIQISKPQDSDPVCIKNDRQPFGPQMPLEKYTLRWGRAGGGDIMSYQKIKIKKILCILNRKVENVNYPKENQIYAHWFFSFN